MIILHFCEPSSPIKLFNDHAKYSCGDPRHKIPAATEDQLMIMIQEDVEDKLMPNNKTIRDLGLPCQTLQKRQQIQQLTEHQAVHNQPTVMQEELGHDYKELRIKAHQCLFVLTPTQEKVADIVIPAIRNWESFCVFLKNAKSGTRKTFLLNTLSAVARTMADTKQVALAVASSGIDATLLHQGRSFLS